MRIVDFLRTHRVVAGVILVDLLIVVAMLVVMIVKATKTATVDILTVPAVAKVQIGLGEYESGAYRIHPGDYDAVVSAEGFEPKTVRVSARAGEISKVYVYLVPEEGGFEWYTLKDNFDDFERLAEIASSSNNITTDQDESAEEFVDEFQDTLALLEELPIKGYVYGEPEESISTAGFTIRDGRDRAECEKSACLVVKYYGVDYEGAVLEKIKEAGYVPVDYQILYERYD